MCHKDELVTSLACKKKRATCSCLITMRPMAASRAQFLLQSLKRGTVSVSSCLRRPRELEGRGVFLSERKSKLGSVEPVGSRVLWERTCLPLSTPPLSRRAPGCRLTDTHCVFRLPLHRQVHIAAACAHAQAQTSEARR